MSRLDRGPGAIVLVCAILAMVLVAGCSDSSKSPEPDPKPAGSEQDVSAGQPAEAFVLASSAFEDGGGIPVEYANTGVSGGMNVSPPLEWVGVPAGTASFAIVCVDRHPMAENWVHWMVVDIPADIDELAEGASGGAMPTGVRELTNTFGASGWGGPQPPLGSGDHDYEITIYALPLAAVDLADDATLAEFEAAVGDAAIGSASVTGLLGR